MAYKNKVDQAKSARRHYLKNKVKIKARARLLTIKMREENRAYVCQYKESHPCIDCGSFYPSYVMDFDHLRDKEAQISQVIGRWSLERLKKEITKCEIRCANCHRIKTYERRMSGKSNGATEAS